MLERIIWLLFGAMGGFSLSLIVIFFVLEFHSNSKEPPTKEEWKVMDYEN